MEKKRRSQGWAGEMLAAVTQCHRRPPLTQGVLKWAGPSELSRTGARRWAWYPVTGCKSPPEKGEVLGKSPFLQQTASASSTPTAGEQALSSWGRHMGGTLQHPPVIK